MKNLVMMVGLPRSGKSTIAKELAKHAGAAIVNPDSVRLAMHGQRYYPPAEPLVWGMVHTMVDALFGAGHSTVILDACSISQKRRDEWRHGGYDRYIIELLTSKEVCLSRAEPDLAPIIERMWENYESPGPWEGLTFWTYADAVEVGDQKSIKGWSSTRQGDVLRELMTTVRANVQ